MILSCQLREGKESGLFDNCQSNGFARLISVTDSTNNVSIDLPYGWLVEKVNNAGFNGIQSMDTILFDSSRQLNSVLVTSIDVNRSYDEHFKNELLNMRLDSANVKVLEAGRVMVANKNSWFVLTSTEENQIGLNNLFVYIEGETPRKIFLLHVSVSANSDYKKEMCRFLDIVRSVKFIQYLNS